jgi:hypothetical protein
MIGRPPEKFSLIFKPLSSFEFPATFAVGSPLAEPQKHIRPEASLTAGCVDRRLRSTPGYLR